MKLTKKVALVTGAARGIGRGIARKFAQEGADVVISDVNCPSQTEELSREIRAQGRRPIAIQANVACREQVEAMFERASNEMGTVDILANNALRRMYLDWPIYGRCNN
jgi:3-oxoacyl-[acyl-carrier protein] reductase